jgi:hypothetical protein
VTTLEPETRQLLGLRKPWWPAIMVTRMLLQLVSVVLGSESTSRQRAQERIERIRSARA